jgi:hypothetical protein
MRTALSAARETIASRGAASNEQCEHVLEEVTGAIANDDVSSAMKASQRAQDDPQQLDGSGDLRREARRQGPAGAHRAARGRRTATVDDIRNELSRGSDGASRKGNWPRE